MTYNYRDDPILGPTLTYWTQKRGARPMPRKRDIDPIELPPKLLPNIQIIEVIDGGARFRYRLVGTASVDAFGSDYTGRYPDEMFTDDRLNFIQSIYRRVYDDQAPAVLAQPLPHDQEHRSLRLPDLHAAIRGRH